MRFFKHLIFTILLVPCALIFCLIFATVDFFFSLIKNLREEFSVIGEFWDEADDGF